MEQLGAAAGLVPWVGALSAIGAVMVVCQKLPVVALGLASHTLPQQALGGCSFL